MLTGRRDLSLLLDVQKTARNRAVFCRKNFLAEITSLLLLSSGRLLGCCLARQQRLLGLLLLNTDCLAAAFLANRCQTVAGCFWRLHRRAATCFLSRHSGCANSGCLAAERRLLWAAAGSRCRGRCWAAGGGAGAAVVVVVLLGLTLTV